MKYLYQPLFLISFIAMLASCSSQTKVVNNDARTFLTNEEFTFIAEKVNKDGSSYTSYTTAQLRGKSWDNLPELRDKQVFTNPKSIDLESGYGMTVTKDELMVNLPSFDGKVTTTVNLPQTITVTTREADKIQFTATDFTVNQKTNKKGKTSLTIIANDINNPITIKMDVYNNGMTYVNIGRGSKKSVSYGGYVAKNAIAKK